MTGSQHEFLVFTDCCGHASSHGGFGLLEQIRSETTWSASDALGIMMGLPDRSFQVRCSHSI